MTKQSVVILSIIISGLLLASGWYILSGPVSAADKRRYSPICEKWISDTMVDGGATQTVDTWKRRGRLVFAIVGDRTDRTGRVTKDISLCVVDKRAGTMIKPSVFELSSWRKWP